jgi:hypothetical protein
MLVTQLFVPLFPLHSNNIPSTTPRREKGATNTHNVQEPNLAIIHTAELVHLLSHDYHPHIQMLQLFAPMLQQLYTDTITKRKRQAQRARLKPGHHPHC